MKVRNSELMLFVVRMSGGQFALMTEEGTVILEAENWRTLRRNLDCFLERDSDRPAKVVICVGRPRSPLARPPARDRVAPVASHPSP
jgi:hypothetical protein